MSKTVRVLLSLITLSSLQTTMNPALTLVALQSSNNQRPASNSSGRHDSQDNAMANTTASTSASNASASGIQPAQNADLEAGPVNDNSNSNNSTPSVPAAAHTAPISTAQPAVPTQQATNVPTTNHHLATLTALSPPRPRRRAFNFKFPQYRPSLCSFNVCFLMLLLMALAWLGCYVWWVVMYVKSVGG